ncbi:MAG: AraC family transcriptional regulator [Candidatus Pseudobacter hemicellulosilyticus]|uniref:AraC family transcriptional regulator n=1 Tax=Candidatus Pseudobacter hemicellulosilyticus TaxID=3121375 RepID=A0AAJ5WWD9_9BACT|nr:MAG: AraC family transcriptional regulator [Pseudobacter sp.]
MTHTLSETELEKIHSVARAIEKNIRAHYTIPELASMAYLNDYQLKKSFKQVYGMGPYAYLLQQRLEKAKALLLEDKPIRNIGLNIGFTGRHAQTNFIKFFKKEMKVSPAVWKKQQWQQTG